MTAHLSGADVVRALNSGDIEAVWEHTGGGCYGITVRSRQHRNVHVFVVGPEGPYLDGDYDRIDNDDHPPDAFTVHVHESVDHDEPAASAYVVGLDALVSLVVGSFAVETYLP